MKETHYLTLTLIFTGGVIALSIFSGSQLVKGVSLKKQPIYTGELQPEQVELVLTPSATTSANQGVYTEEDEEDLLELKRYVYE